MSITGKVLLFFFLPPRAIAYLLVEYMPCIMFALSSANCDSGSLSVNAWESDNPN